MFLSDLVRHMDGNVSLDFMAVSSYAKGTTTSGEVRLLKDLDTTLDGRHVVIVEDIVDTGLTLTYLQDILRARGPKTLAPHCLLSKPSRRQVDVKVEYIGFEIEDRFVVGYGLDYAEQYRNLPYIGVVTAPDGGPHFLRQRIGLADDGVAIRRAHLPVLHQHLAVHDGRSDVVTAGHVDEV